MLASVCCATNLSCAAWAGEAGNPTRRSSSDRSKHSSLSWSSDGSRDSTKVENTLRRFEYARSRVRVVGSTADNTASTAWCDVGPASLQYRDVVGERVARHRAPARGTRSTYEFHTPIGVRTATWMRLATSIAKASTWTFTAATAPPDALTAVTTASLDCVLDVDAGHWSLGSSKTGIAAATLHKVAGHRQHVRLARALAAADKHTATRRRMTRHTHTHTRARTMVHEVLA